MCRSACVKQHSHICFEADTVKMTTSMQAHMTGAQNRQAERKSPGYMHMITLALKTSRRYIWMGRDSCYQCAASAGSSLGLPAHLPKGAHTAALLLLAPCPAADSRPAIWHSLPHSNPMVLALCMTLQGLAAPEQTRQACSHP